MRALLALLLFILSPALSAEVRTTLDRYALTAADTLTLTLEVSDQVEQRPDLSALETDFRIQSSQKVIVSSHASASRDVWTRWHLQLKPRNSGTLRIPQIRLGNELSTSLEVKVSGKAETPGREATRFMDSLISNDQIYSHAQLLFTARLFQRTPLPETLSFSSPALPGALIFTLTEPRRYTADRDGERWHVMEQSFALYPATTGLHTLAGPGIISNDSTEDSLAPDRETFEIEVMPAAHQNSRGYWLPAERLMLEENWQAPANLQPGDSFVREITLTALGLPADALPNLFSTNADTFFAQLEDVSTTETMTAQGLVSTRVERVRIEPLGPGALTLPPIDIHWWNTLAERAATASLPPRQIEVQTPALPDTFNAAGTTVPTATEPSRPATTWWLVSTALGVLCVIGFSGWAHSWHQLRQVKSRSQLEGKEEEHRRTQKLLLSHQRAERNTFQALAIACQQNDAETTRLRLVEWGQNFWPEHSIDSLEALCEAGHSQTLDFLVLDLDHHLHQDPRAWQGDLLLEAIERLRSRRLRNDGEDDETQSLPLSMAS
ncbi:oxygen tolerance protein BatD [Marinobacterium halophilum]|uniref:Oxygen tolerance protein BatD n=1 Tax=Marinobacterium halophilum TaxID=267374 RepID=A0A2P8EUY0_9GAMM|nr:BatD family protein [Marinobacterium halophilum]PSL13235.1 oxygen tolerance protein BatD [Marinobacterium halophilum]